MAKKKQKQPYYHWDKEQGIATCILNDGKNTFFGLAQCHPDDVDFKSEKTGLTLAESRAELNALKHYKNNVIKPELNALKQLYYSMNKSKHFNSKSYEAKMLFKQISIKEQDLETIREMIKDKRIKIKSFIDDKDEFYRTVQKNREVNNK